MPTPARSSGAGRCFSGSNELAEQVIVSPTSSGRNLLAPGTHSHALIERAYMKLCRDPVAGTLSAMSLVAPLASVLRLLVLAMLMAGVLVKPVLAAECGISDAAHVLVETSQAGVAAAPDLPTGEDCCSFADCNDCCAHAAAVMRSLDAMPAVPMTASLMPSLSVDFKPIACPVPFRPPIAA